MASRNKSVELSVCSVASSELKYALLEKKHIGGEAAGK
jgi:hypothetical protein